MASQIHRLKAAIGSTSATELHFRQAVEAAFPDLQPTWLETRAGGDQVFLVERDRLPT